LQEDKVDVFHSTFNFGLPVRSPCATVLTLHDAIDKAYYDRESPLGEQLSLSHLMSSAMTWSSRARANAIITVSEHARGDLIRHFGISPNKLEVYYEAADERFHVSVSESERKGALSKYGISAPYIFYVGGWERRKNVGFLLRAFAQATTADAILVCAGAHSNDQRAALEGQAQSLKLHERLRLIGPVVDEDLPALYSQATAFVYPSEYEGFGLQLCEAMAVGCPTFAARATALPEVLGDGGECFSLADADELAGQLSRVISDPSYRASLSAKASSRSEFFSWSKAAQATKALYERLCRPTTHRGDNH
jgi:glycosyltransferase involved in cell wall biosynthesis